MGMPVDHLDTGREPAYPHRRSSNTQTQTQTPSEQDRQANVMPSTPHGSIDNQPRQQEPSSSRDAQRQLEATNGTQATTSSAPRLPRLDIPSPEVIAELMRIARIAEHDAAQLRIEDAFERRGQPNLSSSASVLGPSGLDTNGATPPSPARDAPAPAPATTRDSYLFIIAGPASNVDSRTSATSCVRRVDERRMQQILAIVGGPPSDGQHESDGRRPSSPSDGGIGDATRDIEDQRNGGT
ncbi:MAG: hypothetical protein M1836_000703 [Candelina mexicana]|nr:MAG: hypothetical protein M1836_000703 [Candelina mexicana]